jgi:hypothetical protein
VREDGALQREELRCGRPADLASEFSIVKRAGIVSATGTHIASASVSGTVITIPTGPLDDGVWLLAVGVAK